MKSPRSRLRAKLKQTATTEQRLLQFPNWLARQLVRSWPEVSHNQHPFMLLFRFDMTDDPITHDVNAMVGSRLDVLLIKVNGGIYYHSSTHMDGLQQRIGKEIKITPAQLLYVHSPSTHVKGAEVDITSDISKLSYVATIPASFVREGKEWDVPLKMDVHLPTIREG